MSWYTGEDGPDPARGTAIARVDQSVTVQYGARANEEAFRYELQTIAVYAAVTTNASSQNANAQVTALANRISANLAPQAGQQSIQDVQAQFAGAQSAIKAATDRHTQLKSGFQSISGPRCPQANTRNPCGTVALLFIPGHASPTRGCCLGGT